MENKYMEALKALQEKETGVHAFLDVFPEIIWIASPKGMLDYANPSFYEYTGWEPGQHPGLPCVSYLVHEEDLANSLACWKESLQSGKAYKCENRIRRKHDGAYLWHIVRAIPLHNAQGEVEKWLGSSVNIHAQKQLNEQVSTFMYEATHDLKSPVNNIKSLLALFKLQPQAEWEELLAYMEKAVLKLDHTLQELIDKARSGH